MKESKQQEKPATPKREYTFCWIRIRIKATKINEDSCGSGSTTLIKTPKKPLNQGQIENVPKSRQGYRYS
jgi:hypothetical protein